MNRFVKAYKIFQKDKGLFFAHILLHVGFFLPDTIYLRLMYRLKKKCKLNLKRPATFNEKLNWLKIHDRKPLYKIIVDKYAVKQYIANKVGEQYLIPSFGVWNNFDDIDFEKLPNQFVLKCTHDSGGLVICKNKTEFDIDIARKTINKSLKRNYYRAYREWPYRDVPPRIIAEKYMENENGELLDYKFFCFDGEPKFLQVDFCRFSDHHRNIYDLDWNLLPVEMGYPSDPQANMKKPVNFNEMVRLSKILSKGFPHIRCDFYSVEGRTYFGELTLYHGGGFRDITPNVWNEKWGDLIKLPL